MQQRSRMARRLLVPVAAVWLVTLCSSSGDAGVVYTVDRTVGAGRITGTIETNGATGVLAASDLVAWNLTIDADGDPSTTGQLVTGNSSVSALTPGVLSATATELFFDFSAPGMSLFQMTTMMYDVVWQMQAGIFSDELIRESSWVQAYEMRPAEKALIGVALAPVSPMELVVRQVRLRDDTGARVRLRADFVLGAGSNGIDPSVEEVALQLSTPFGPFYPGPCDVVDLRPGDFVRDDEAEAPRWHLTEAARARTGIERFDITAGSVSFVDRHTALPFQDYSQVTVTLRIGDDAGSAPATLVARPAGGSNWYGR